jgi:hypothetical protein
MSRSLPPHPNLEHLKKQAKDLLRDLKKQNPALKLSDTQYALAREYGFASWPKLKAYVEALPRLVKPATEPVTPSGDNYDNAKNADNSPPIDSRSAAVTEKANLFVGTWTANLSKSKRHPANPFQSATLQFIVDGDTVTIIDVVVDASGYEEHGKNTILADGNEHPSQNGNGYVLTAAWRGSHVLETMAKKDGQVAGLGTYAVSDNGKTLTISGDDQVIVLDRT